MEKAGKPREKSPYAGMVVKTKPDVGIDLTSGRSLGDLEFHIEDWWENVSGQSWMNSDGNPAAMNYAFRIDMGGGKVPLDNEVLYGKIGWFGYLFHVSELCLPEVG